MDGEYGITADDLPSIYLEAYVNAIEAARHEHDPHHDWEGFVEYLWQALAPALGLKVGPRNHAIADLDLRTRERSG